MLATVLLRLGTSRIHGANSDWDAADSILHRALAVADRAFGKHHHERAAILLQLARVKAHLKQHGAAESLSQEALVSRLYRVRVNCEVH